jgi:tetratricopeptide (TPR) repeat protein
VDLEEAKKAIQRLSPNRLCLGGLLDLGSVVGVVDKRVGAFLLGLFGVGYIGGLMGAGIAELVSKLLRRLLERWGIAKNETIECLRNIVNTAKEASQYIDDEGLRDVVEEVARKWGWDVDTFRRFVKTAAGKSVTEDEVRRMIEEALKRIEEELENIKRNIEEELRKVESKIEGSKIGIGIFFLNDVENGLLYGNFIVEGGVPKIKTQLGTAENEPEIDLVDTGKFREVAEDVLSRLTRGGRVVLTGPRGIGKSTLATYVAWRSLLGGLGKVVLDKSMDAVIRVDSLNPGNAARLNNLIKTTGRRFVVIYDPSPIEAYIEPESMGETRYDVESIKKTLSMLLRMRNAWVIIVLPKELYDEVSKDATLKSVLDEVRNYVINVDLKDEGFLSEIVKRYSGCGDVSEHLVERIMEFDSYTLIAKYVGVWLRENKCQVKDVDEALRESAGEPKLFFAHYIWGTILGKSMDLARRVSVPLILHAAFGPIPEGFAYIMKALSEGGVWKLIDRDYLAKSKLEDLREDDLEPIAKWLSTWHEDLIEETLKDLVGLHGEEVRNNYRNHGFENFIKALDWGYEKALEEVRGLGRETKPEEVETNLLIFVSERLKNALKPYTNCWKRAALIIGYASAGRVLVPRPEDLRKDVIESLGDALNRCGVDDYLLVGNVTPPLIRYLTYIHVSTEAFIDKYNEAVAEVNRILNIARGRGSINPAEVFYGLGLASIIAKAVESGKPVGPSDADAALDIASFAIQRVASPDLIRPILRILESLHGKAPQRYIELLALASNMENLDLITVRYIFRELNEILGNYGDVVKEHAWSLVHAIDAYAVLLRKYFGHFNSEEVGDMVGRVVDLLNKLGKFKSSLGVIAWADALTPALGSEYVRRLMEEKLGINVVDKASEVAKELGRLRGLVQELMGDKEFMGYVESKSVKADEKAVKTAILEAASHLKHALAHYRLDNDELDKAEKLFKKAAEEDREIGDYENYLIARGWVLRVDAIKGSLVGDELVKKFQQLYEEAFSKEHFEPTAPYLSIASARLGEYLVSLALTGNYEMIGELLEEHLLVLNTDRRASVLTRLALNALLRPRVGLSGELEGRLIVESRELIDAFGYGMLRNYLPALMVAFGVIKKPEDGAAVCMSLDDLTKEMACMYAISVAMNDNAAVVLLRGWLINRFRGLLFEKLGLLKELGVDADKLIDEFRGLVNGLDGKSLVQLPAPTNSLAQLALMLHALINGDGKLAKAHALIGTVEVTEKLPARLFLEAYKACCDPNNDEFRRAIAKLFLYHV